MSSNPAKSEAINGETTKSPKESSDWLGGPQNGSEIPGNGGNGGNGGNASGSGNGGNGAVTQNGNETPSKSTEEAYQQNGQSDRSGTGKSESDYTKHRFD